MAIFLGLSFGLEQTFLQDAVQRSEAIGLLCLFVSYCAVLSTHGVPDPIVVIIATSTATSRATSYSSTAWHDLTSHSGVAELPRTSERLRKPASESS